MVVHAAVPLPVSVTRLVALSEMIPDSFVTQVGDHLVVSDDGFTKAYGCWCRSCADTIAAAGEVCGFTTFRGMILCPDCGNKRCPRATSHDESCTGSNEPGQVGSAYGIARGES